MKQADVRLDVHHYFHGDDETLALLKSIEKRIIKMSAELDRLTASVAAEKTADDSLIALVSGLAQQIRDNAGNPAALTALADSLDSDQAAIAAAVAANTPAAA